MRSAIALAALVAWGCGPRPEAPRDEGFERVRAMDAPTRSEVAFLEAENAAIEVQNAALRQRIERLEDALARGAAGEHVCPATEALSELRGCFPATLAVVPVPKIDTEVLAVGADGHVVLADGRSAGVEQGYHFTVYRGSEFVGKVVVDFAAYSASGARVLFTAPGKAIRPGDQAATILD